MQEIVVIIRITETTFDEFFKVTSVPFFIPDFSLLSCELALKQNFTFKAKLKPEYSSL